MDAMVSPTAGQGMYDGVLDAHESSPFSDKSEVIPVRFNYGDRRFSPRLMAELVNDYQANAVILSGSEKNFSEEGNAWLQDYLFGLDRLFNEFPAMPVFGICFGHQAIARYFGGEIARFKYAGGLRSVEMRHMATFHPVFREFLKEKKLGDPLKLAVSHGDQVIRIPENFHLLASSEHCECQALAHDTRPILSTQSHPEFNYSIKQYTTDKQYWEHYTEEDFADQDGPRFLHLVFKWMHSEMV